MSAGQAIRWVFQGDELAIRALRRRAEKNFRSPLHELRYIVYEALAPEIEAIRAELAAELPDVDPNEEVSHE